jgi:DNA-binding transcriptional MerR regulator
VAKAQSEAVELTYPLRAAARLTGLSPELLRAWERRYGAVQPARTPGGTRRYTASDLERLRLLKAAVDAGRRIGHVAHLGMPELSACIASRERETRPRAHEEVLDALDRLDGEESRRLLAVQLAALGPLRFAREVALPLVREIGQRWAAGQIGIASEHLGSGVLRAMLGSALQPGVACLLGPRVVFATPSGERHEIGLQMAALTAMGAGANPLYLGAEVPVEDLLDAVDRTDAAALALSLVSLATDAANRALRALRGGLSDDVPLWVGGCGAGRTKRLPGIETMDSLDEFERRVELLAFQRQGWR